MKMQSTTVVHSIAANCTYFLIENTSLSRHVVDKNETDFL